MWLEEEKRKSKKPKWNKKPSLTTSDDLEIYEGERQGKVFVLSRWDASEESSSAFGIQLDIIHDLTAIVL